VAAPAPTNRLTFHEMTLDDLDDMSELLGDPEVMRYYDRPKTRKEAEDWIQWNLRLYADHGYGLWLLRLRETGDFVGDCGLTQQTVDGRTYVELGYHVRASMQRRGLASEAATACRRYAAEELGLDYLIAIIDPNNRPSQRVAEKIGLTAAWRTTTMNEGGHRWATSRGPTR
jgi:RimJ/RimL family protein N-acetyltransferase